MMIDKGAPALASSHGYGNTARGSLMSRVVLPLTLG